VKQSLRSRKVLVLDCQTTGANPERGHLLEVAWAWCSVEEGCYRVRALLVRQPEGAEIPSRVSRLTGIDSSMMDRAVDAEVVWRELLDEVGPREYPVPCLIHYARFEMPFLRHLHRCCGSQEPFPLGPVCLHEVARRLFPELPRRGLRALAGFWGHSIGELKRSADHVRATAHIWDRMVDELAVRGIASSIEELEEWLKQPFEGRGRRTAFSYAISRDVMRNLPDAPGVYRFYRSNGDILYVGKARSLRRRVRSYFGRRPRHAEHILEMVTQAAEVKVQRVSSPVMAAILESDEIKRLDPPYNRQLRSGEREAVYFDDSLSCCGRTLEHHLRRGPVGSSSLILSAGELVRMAAAPAFDAAKLGPSVNWLPEEASALLTDGYSLWRERWAGQLHESSAYRFVVLASRSLTETEAAADVMDESEPAASEPVVDEDRQWEAEDVADVLDSVIREAGRQLDRGEWLRALADSEVRWRRGTSRWQGLSLSRWAITELPTDSDSRRDNCAQCPEVSPGFPKPFEIGDFDRVSVLSAELKRLCRDGAEVEVRLASHRVLRGPRLEAILTSRG